MDGNQCHCCLHRERPAIDLALARGVSVSALAKRYDVSTHSLHRHRRAHLSPQLRAKLLCGPDTDIDLDRLRESESQSLLAHVVAIRHRLFAALDTAEEAGDVHKASVVVAQLHRNLELTGKLLGDLGIGHSVTNNILITSEYVELRQAITGALRGFPDAARSVAAALREVEAKAA